MAGSIGEGEPGLRGLRNMGNTCFINVTLQALSNTKAFRQYFLDDFEPGTKVTAQNSRSAWETASAGFIDVDTTSVATSATSDSAVAPASAAPEPAAAVPVKRKRGRPRKIRIESNESADPPQATAVAASAAAVEAMPAPSIDMDAYDDGILGLALFGDTPRAKRHYTRLRAIQARQEMERERERSELVRLEKEATTSASGGRRRGRKGRKSSVTWKDDGRIAVPQRRTSLRVRLRQIEQEEMADAERAVEEAAKASPRRSSRRGRGRPRSVSGGASSDEDEDVMYESAASRSSRVRSPRSPTPRVSSSSDCEDDFQSADDRLHVSVPGLSSASLSPTPTRTGKPSGPPWTPRTMKSMERVSSLYAGADGKDGEEENGGVGEPKTGSLVNAGSADDSYLLCDMVHHLLRVLWSESVTDAVIHPNLLVTSVWTHMAEKFPRREQQDAQEFVGFLMRALDAELTGVEDNFVENQVRGYQIYRTRCEACSADSETREPFVQLRLQFPPGTDGGGAFSTRRRRPPQRPGDYLATSTGADTGSSGSGVGDDGCQDRSAGGGDGKQAKKKKKKPSLVDFVSDVCAEEVVEGFNCEACGRTGVRAIRQCYFELPKVLVVSLNRITWNGSSVSKIRTHVDFPVADDLDLTPFQQAELETQFKLSAVVVHHGRAVDLGHYTVFAKHQSARWYEYDDHRVERVHPTDVATSQGYVFIYERFRSRKRLSQTVFGSADEFQRRSKRHR